MEKYNVLKGTVTNTVCYMDKKLGGRSVRVHVEEKLSTTICKCFLDGVNKLQEKSNTPDVTMNELMELGSKNLS